MTARNILKAELKHGPRFRQCVTRALYVGFLINAGPRTLTPGPESKIRTELARLEVSGNPYVQRFVREMYLRYPEVKK
jgi:hypothetical protein